MEVIAAIIVIFNILQKLRAEVESVILIFILLTLTCRCVVTFGKG